jgi:hypothetical protein
MPYITARGRVDSIDDTSYEREVVKDGNKVKETVQKFQLTLSIPGSSEAMKFDMTPEVAPPSAKADQWETDETWVVVTADAMRILSGSTEGRAWALVTFTATKVEEMSAAERQALQAERKKVKVARKQRAAEKKQAKAAAKQAKPVAA